MSLEFIWKLFFVIGVVLMAIGSNAPVAWASRVAWILWAVAAIIWLVAGGVHA